MTFCQFDFKTCYSPFAILFLWVWIVACAPAPIQTPTAIATATRISIVAPTSTRTATETTAPTSTVTATETETATATHTPTHTPAIPDWQYTNTAVMQTLAAPTRTPTALPQALLKQDAILYSGPGNVGYAILAQLKANTNVSIFGAFVDFAKVRARVNGTDTEGFILKSALQSLSPSTTELSVEQVPWQPVPILNNFIGDHTIFQNGQIKLVNTTAGYYDVEGTAIPLDGPVMVTGNFQTDSSNYGAVKVLGIPEPPTAEWWRGINRMFVWGHNGKYQLLFWDGHSSDSSSIYLPILQGQTWAVVFKDSQGKTLSVLDKDGKEIKVVDVTKIPGLNLPNGLFPHKKLYLGASSAPHSTLTLHSVSLRFTPTGKQSSTPVTSSGLRSLAAQKGIMLGTEFEMWRMRDPRYWNIMSKDFGLVFLESFSSCNKSFWLGRGAYDFSALDATVNFLVSQGWRVRAATLVWGTTEPAVCKPPDSIMKGKFSREEYIQILQEHVKTVVSHFRGRVSEWTLANEAIGRSFCGGGCDYWMDWIGPDYIEIAFRAAREADPDAVLIFNEVNNESPRDANTQAVIDKMYDTVKTLRSKGVPIDGVGMQMHLLLPGLAQTPPSKDDVIKTMQRFGSLGVSIYVTEFDMNLTNVPGSQQDKWNYEASMYHDMMQACLESGVCKSFSTWGIADSTSWITCSETKYGCVNLPNADPLMFDKDFQPKPAYYAVRDALLGK